MKRYIILFNIFTITFCYCEEDIPKRIVSLGPAITEDLYLLGAGDRLIGCTIYCKRPKDAEKKEKVGTVVDVDVEKIIALRPDLVLATSLTNQNDLEKLKEAGINVINFPTPKNFPQLCSHFIRLGRLIGKKEEARSIVKRERRRVGAISLKVMKLSKPKVFIQTGTRPLYTANKGSFINDYIVRAGAINIAGDSKGGGDYGIYSREQVLKENPDVIIIVTMGIAGEKERQLWKRFNTIDAVRNNRIFIVDAYKMCSPTPVSFTQMLEEISRILHSEEV